MKQAVASGQDSNLHLSWIESHSTSIGAPDLNYCYYGTHEWMELKCGPDIDVRAAQVVWMEDRIIAGGFPLFLIQYGDIYSIVPGSAAATLREEPHEENILRHARAIWQGKLPADQLLRIMRNPRRIYERNS